MIEDLNSLNDLNQDGLQPIIDNGDITPVFPEPDPIPDLIPDLNPSSVPDSDSVLDSDPIPGPDRVGGFDCTSGCAGNCAGSCNWMCQNSAHNDPI